MSVAGTAGRGVSSAGPVVETTAGRVRGRTHPVGHVFKGIPFAAPPVGRNRWQAPAPAEPWPGVRSADDFGPICHQRPGPIEQATGMVGVPMSEDCLSVNVWTPAVYGAKRPVMVWIHGGGFTGGAGSSPFYDGRRLAQRGDVVVVTFNYRLGVFGFLHLSDLGGEGWESAGNSGLLDQMAVLRWVQDNIEGFGGDPGNVTVFGESAGAFSIADLLAAPTAAGLFHRAILQSGHTSAVRDRSAATAIARTVLDPLGVEPTRLAALYDVPADQLLNAQARAAGAHDGLGMPFAPVVDEVLLPIHPQEAVETGRTLPVRFVTGTNRDEMRLFMAVNPQAYAVDDDDLEDRVARLPGVGPDRAPDLVSAYRGWRPAASTGQVLAAVQTDWAFRIPAIRHAEAQAAAGQPAWMYWFTFATPAFAGALGACHGLDVPFVFDALQQPGVEMFTGSDPSRSRLADAMAGAWLAFARTGDPGWPTYEPDGNRTTRRFDVDSEDVDDPDGETRALWKDVIRR